MKTEMCMAVALLSAGVSLAMAWNDMVPWSNTADTAFWNSTGHQYVENFPSAAFPVSGTLSGGGATVVAEVFESFDGRPSCESASPFVKILESGGVLLILR